MENRRGWLGRGGLSFSSHPCQHGFFLLLPEKPTASSPSLWSTAPHTHGPLPRPFREFHIGNGQVRRNAGGGVPGTTTLMGCRLCSPTIIRFSVRCPAAPAGGSAGQTQLVPAGLGEMRTSGWALQLRITRVCPPSRYCEAVVLRVCPSLTYDGS